MNDKIVGAHGDEIDADATYELVADLVSDPKSLSRPMEHWPLYARQEFSFALALFGDMSFKVDISAAYLAGLAYLAIIASCVTFFMYFSLVQRIGPASASYTLALVPVVALLLSALFENLTIDGYVIAGGIAVLFGNILVLSAPARQPAPAKVVQGKEKPL